MSVTTLPSLGIPPNSITRPGTFNADADAFFGALPAFRDAFNANVPGIQAIADLAPLVASAASYKGPWATLAAAPAGPDRALAIPASTTHSGKPWLLTESVADVAAHEPGVSSKWLLMKPPTTVELIDSVDALGAALVQWTNFEALASSYSCLRLVASGLIGSAASANLNGQIKISGTFQAATAWHSASAGAVVGGVSLSASNQLKNTASKALALDLNVYALGITQHPAVAFTSLGGHDNVSGYTYPVVGGSYFDVDVAPTTPIQGLRISASTGTLTGSFRLYGVRKS